MVSKRIYGEVKSVGDIRKINTKIRKDVMKARTQP